MTNKSCVFSIAHYPFKGVSLSPDDRINPKSSTTAFYLWVTPAFSYTTCRPDGLLSHTSWARKRSRTFLIVPKAYGTKVFFYSVRNLTSDNQVVWSLSMPSTAKEPLSKTLSTAIMTI